MNYIILGNVLAIIGAMAFLPQIYNIIKTKNTSGLSLTTYLIYSMGIAGWGIYGSFIGSIPNFVLNTFVIGTALPLYYYLFKNKNITKWFWPYLMGTIFVICINIVLLTTRLLDVWGPLVNSDENIYPRPTYYIALSWIISMIGAVCSGTSFFPQIIKSWRLKSVNVNFFFMIIIFSTQLAWVVFWVFKAQIPVSLGEWFPGLISGVFTSGLQFILIIFWIIFKYSKVNKKNEGNNV